MLMYISTVMGIATAPKEILEEVFDGSLLDIVFVVAKLGVKEHN